MLPLYCCLLVAQIDIGVFGYDYLVDVRLIRMLLLLGISDDEFTEIMFLTVSGDTFQKTGTAGASNHIGIDFSQFRIGKGATHVFAVDVLCTQPNTVVGQALAGGKIVDNSLKLACG